MMQDIKYTKEVEPLILAYHNIFDLLCYVWSGEYKMPVELRIADEKNPHYGEWLPIIRAYESIDFNRLQSTILSKELRYLVPHRKEKSKRILERRFLADKLNTTLNKNREMF